MKRREIVLRLKFEDNLFLIIFVIKNYTDFSLVSKCTNKYIFEKFKYNINDKNGCV